MSPYQPRLIYEVNFLAPKPWINDGTAPDGGLNSYPILPEPTDFTPLITPVKSGDSLIKTFNKRSQQLDLFPMTLSKNFISWYLSYATAFAARHQVPMVVDQFGASTVSVGQLDYERDVINITEDAGIGWCRWGYNAGSPPRFIEGNPAVHLFYHDIGQARSGP